MFSKALRILLSACFLVSCARESDPPTSPAVFDLKGGSSCLESINESLADYLKGQMSSAKVGEFWDCTIRAVADYERLTTGDAPGGGYTPQALRSFIQRYFFREKRPLSDALLISIMEFKRVILSGATTEITRREIATAKDFLTELKRFTVEINPDLAILAFNKDNPSDVELRMATLHLSLAAAHLSAWLSQKSQPYSFRQMHDFIMALQEWGETTKPSSPTLMGQFQKILIVLPSLKKILVGGKVLGIDGHEWPSVVQTLVRGYSLFLSVHALSSQDLNSGLIREIIPDQLEQLAEVFVDAVHGQSGHQIPAQDFEDLFKALEVSQLLPKSMSASAMSATWTWFQKRMLSASGPEFTQAEAMRLHERALGWQSLLKDQLPDTPEANSFLKVRNDSVPMQWDSRGRLMFPKRGEAQWSPTNQRQLVWSFSILNWLKVAYAGNQVDQDLTPDQVNLAFEEILPLLQSFGWLKDTVPSRATRLLREADLFTLASNGDGRLSLSEATRYLIFVASAYRTADVWLNIADEKCGSRQATCARPLAFTSDEILAPFERLKGVLQSDPQPMLAWLKYSVQGEETVLGEKVVGSFSVGSLMQSVVIMEYVETFLRYYDADLSETVSLQEGRQAFQVFGPTLQNLLAPAGVPPEEILDFFTFLLKYGDTPFSMFGGQVLYTHWKWHRNDWAFESDRSHLMSILNQLSKL